MTALRREDFCCVAREGLGDPSARIVQAMFWSGDGLYVGTGGRSRYPLGLSASALARLGPLGDRLRQRDATQQNRPIGARLWRFDPQRGDWRQIYRAPEVSNGQGECYPRDRNIRAATVFASANGPGGLYVGASAMEGAFHLLRSVDGVAFVDIPHHNLGLPPDADIPSVRALCPLNGRLYTSPVGKLRGRGMLDDNISDYPIVFETDDPEQGAWRAVSASAFGDPTNLSINELVVFAGALYAGTLNIQHGYQVWKTDVQGASPYRWRKVLERGAGRGPAASIVTCMAAFRGALYIGSALQRQGHGGLDRYGPIPGELVRLYPDDTWELVVGESRPTPQGLKVAMSGLGAGFGDRFNRGPWCLAEHEGWLYAGASDWRIFKTFLPGPDSHLSARYKAALRDSQAGYRGGFALWRTADGVTWEPVTCNGFGDDPAIYAVRTLVSTPFGLFAGTAGSRGGFQVWRGAAASASSAGNGG
ncbi:MAG: hypothetical protein KDJ31_14910 [Candidatus Competibacteraceae bacterium]|nr:hypothetical protein [Candidatus Competibacteraceae bacterium]MCB1821093.1 hypothetical protein [Candidatus Competibacteraceae bacterium]HRY15563.1 hypothetical protein [Candidatus Competibacteraceae bacterium]